MWGRRVSGRGKDEKVGGGYEESGRDESGMDRIDGRGWLESNILVL